MSSGPRPAVMTCRPRSRARPLASERGVHLRSQRGDAPTKHRILPSRASRTGVVVDSPGDEACGETTAVE